ncbi:hypothetical protein C8R47DRAFT_1277500 [Mycena vitilis]|nr:hypothetical protein C8R47DRAFT_1277500 [Mycena vitilis]
MSPFWNPRENCEKPPSLSESRVPVRPLDLGQPRHNCNYTGSDCSTPSPTSTTDGVAVAARLAESPPLTPARKLGHFRSTPPATVILPQPFDRVYVLLHHLAAFAYMSLRSSAVPPPLCRSHRALRPALVRSHQAVRAGRWPGSIPLGTRGGTMRTGALTTTAHALSSFGEPPPLPRSPPLDLLLPFSPSPSLLLPPSVLFLFLFLSISLSHSLGCDGLRYMGGDYRDGRCTAMQQRKTARARARKPACPGYTLRGPFPAQGAWRAGGIASAMLHAPLRRMTRGPDADEHMVMIPDWTPPPAWCDASFREEGARARCPGASPL